jgi:hypothetical protein
MPALTAAGRRTATVMDRRHIFLKKNVAFFPLFATVTRPPKAAERPAARGRLKLVGSCEK